MGAICWYYFATTKAKLSTSLSASILGEAPTSPKFEPYVQTNFPKLEQLKGKKSWKKSPFQLVNEHIQGRIQNKCELLPIFTKLRLIKDSASALRELWATTCGSHLTFRE